MLLLNPSLEKTNITMNEKETLARSARLRKRARLQQVLLPSPAWLLYCEQVLYMCKTDSIQLETLEKTELEQAYV